MPYTLFHDVFPEVAERENRVIKVFPDHEGFLPPGEYSFLEMYCDEAGCDCRWVFFYVVSSIRRDVEAVIYYGWDTPEFYRRWMHDESYNAAELKGPGLNVGSPQSALAPAILALVKNVLLQDESYIERLKRHYRMFRKKIDAKADKKSKR